MSPGKLSTSTAVCGTIKWQSDICRSIDGVDDVTDLIPFIDRHHYLWDLDRFSP
jgi:hypothetical protein